MDRAKKQSGTTTTDCWYLVFDGAVSLANEGELTDDNLSVALGSFVIRF